MKKLVASLMLFCILLTSLAQSDTTPVYKKFPVLPVLKLIATPDSVLFTLDNLPKKKPVLFFLFSPDCDHCKKAFTNMMNNIQLFDKVQIVMTSPIRYDLLKIFYEEHHLEKYQNIVVARDPGAYLNTFFANKSFPGLFLYDKKGRLLNEVREHPDFKKIAELF